MAPAVEILPPEFTFESEFLANIVMPGGELVGEIVRPRIAQVYASGEVQPLLPAPKSEDGE